MKTLLFISALTIGMASFPGLYAQTTSPAMEELPAPPKTTLTFFKKMKIRFDEKTSTAGAIGFDSYVDGEPARRTWIHVRAKLDADDVAELVAKELAPALGTDYKVKASDESVLIKPSGKNAKPIAITIAGVTSNGISVMVDED